MFVHICTRQVLGTEITVNVYWERKGLLDRLSISVIVQIKRRRRRRKNNRMDRYLDRSHTDGDQSITIL